MGGAIAILSHYSNGMFMRDLMASLEGAAYPIVIVSNDCDNSPLEHTNYLNSLRSDAIRVIFKKEDQWDTQLLRVMRDETDYDEWFFLHDICEILDHEIFDICFKDNEGRSVCVCQSYFNFIGKYTRKDILATRLPVTLNKLDAISSEGYWCPIYSRQSQAKWLYERETMYERFEIRHGVLVMAVKGRHIIKYKRSWDKQSMVNRHYPEGLLFYLTKDQYDRMSQY